MKPWPAGERACKGRKRTKKFVYELKIKINIQKRKQRDRCFAKEKGTKRGKEGEVGGGYEKLRCVTHTYPLPTMI